MSIFGLLGYPLDHSWSPDYFTKKFAQENNHTDKYQLFPLPDIKDFPSLIKNTKDLKGLNVTLPFKSAVIPFLDRLDPVAREINAVNTIKVSFERDTPVTEGYNTDIKGFEHSFTQALKPIHQRALVFGTGGASKAVTYVLKKLGIPFTLVSRLSGPTDTISYQELEEKGVSKYFILINTTPLGQFPGTGNPLSSNLARQITPDHYLFDLVYNPPVTEFLNAGKEKGAICVNGMEMLIHQAEESWNIWNIN